MCDLKLILCLVSMVIYSCHGIKIYFPDEDNWEETDDMFKDVKYQPIQVIFPGTKWCGTGDIAENDNDLGTAIDTDKCCRAHDWCDDIIESGHTKYNLTNNSYYTRLNCKCDYTFYECLKNANTRTSRSVGNVYFNVLGTKCYKKDFPIIGCLRYHKFLRNRCLEYKLDSSGEKVYQWFDVPVYKSLQKTV